MKKTNLPVQLSKPPAWGNQMTCEGCGFKRVYWLGMTKDLYYHLMKGEHQISKCNKCGCGLMKTSDGELPIFIFKNV